MRRTVAARLRAYRAEGYALHDRIVARYEAAYGAGTYCQHRDWDDVLADVAECVLLVACADKKALNALLVAGVSADSPRATQRALANI